MKLFTYKILKDREDEDKESRVIDYIGHYPYGQDGFSEYIIDGDIICSSKEKVMQHALSKIDDLSLLIMIEELELDKELDDAILTFFNCKTKKEYNFSWNRELIHNKVNYAKGDWIYFYYNRGYHIGQISEMAEGEEPYLVTMENTALSDSSSHGHIAESHIFYKMEESNVKKILPPKFYSNIKFRNELREFKKG